MLEVGRSHTMKTHFSVSIKYLEMHCILGNAEKWVKHRNESWLVTKHPVPMGHSTSRNQSSVLQGEILTCVHS